MKTIGIIGGLSWESSQLYYRIINETVRKRLGGLNSARLLLNSVNFQDVMPALSTGDWPKISRQLVSAAQALKAGGAECIVLCTNTMHKLADEIEHASGLPLLHIADAAADFILPTGLNRLGLLGTRFTMEQDFYVRRLREQHGFEVIVPEAEDRAFIDRVIFDELCQGRILAASRQKYRAIIETLADRGAEGVLLACTEIPLLIQAEDSALPLFDTTAIHARHAAGWALPRNTS